MPGDEKGGKFSLLETNAHPIKRRVLTYFNRTDATSVYFIFE